MSVLLSQVIVILLLVIIAAVILKVTGFLGSGKKGKKEEINGSVGNDSGDETKAMNLWAVQLLDVGGDVIRMKEIDCLEKDFTIGKSAESDLVLDNSEVSKNHAYVTVNSDGVYLLVDDRSLNGTFIDKKRIEQEPLRDGMTVYFASVPVRFIRLDPFKNNVIPDKAREEGQEEAVKVKKKERDIVRKL